MRKIEYIGMVVGRASWKKLREKAIKIDTVSSSRGGRYGANMLFRTHDNRYFVTSYGRAVKPRLQKYLGCIYVYERIWVSEDVVKELEKNGLIEK